MAGDPRVLGPPGEMIGAGKSPEEVCRQHEDLKLAEAHAAMAYYYDHRNEIDEEIQKELASLERASGGLPTEWSAVGGGCHF